MLSKQEREELKKSDAKIAEKVLANPKKYMRPGLEAQGIHYGKLEDEFKLPINRCYAIKRVVETELAKRAQKKS